VSAIVFSMVLFGCGNGETEFAKLERDACACKDRDCARAADKRLEKLLLKALSADDPKAAAEANLRTLECIQRVEKT